MMSRSIAKGVLATAAALASQIACATLLYTNGFESNTSDWTNTTQVASGTGGITSAGGSFHAEVTSGGFSRWGGYNYGAGNAVPTSFQEYRTSVDIYLDVGGNFTNDQRFDFTSAINNAGGTHLRDFAFNVGFYDDASAPGSGDRFVISASNNTGRANSFPKNPGRSPVAIATTGWYSFEHHFYDLGGVLAVDLTIFDAADVAVASWTLSNAADLIAGVGGNRYGWFSSIEMPSLAIDNAFLEVIDAAAPVPEPAALALVGLALLGLGSTRRKRASA